MYQPIPFLSGHSLFLFLLQIFLIISVAIALGRLARRFGLPSLVGEIAAGVLLGPSVLQNIWPDLASTVFPTQSEQFHLLDAVGQVGVLLLVAFAATDLDATVKKKPVSTVFISATGLLVPLCAGVAIGLALPLSLRGNGSTTYTFVLFLGVALCVSAIPVIAKTLTDMDLMHRNFAQLTLSAAVIDDTVAWFLLSVVSALAVGGLTGATLLGAGGALVGTLIFALLVARPLVKKLVGWIGHSGEPALASGVVVALVLVSAAGTQAIGLETMLGAFICGMLIRRYLPRNSQALLPLRIVAMGVLAPIFFATAGLRMDLTDLLKPSVAFAAISVLVVATVGKFLGAYIGSRLCRLGHWEAVAVGSALNARGVVEIIIAMAGLRLGIISSEMFSIIVLVAVITSLMAPPLLRAAVARIRVTDEERRKHAKYSAMDEPSIP